MVKISDLLSEIQTGVASPTTPNFSAAANNDFRRPAEKHKKPETANSSRPISDPRRDAKNLNGKKPASTTSSPLPAPTSAPAPPKKGSFAEIMARGKAAQTTAPQVGKIQHKKIEKLPSKREREEALVKKSRNIKEGLKPGSKFQKAGLAAARIAKNGESSKLDKNGKVPAEPEKKTKKAATATTGYTGTARPKTGGGASSRFATSSSARDRLQASKRSSSARYAYASEEDEDEEDDIEEEGYESDGSSDMEAAAFEVDEEEEVAARIARQEDAEALREENRLKKEKLERQKRMQALQKKAKNSKERY
jgi:protein SPT2